MSRPGRRKASELGIDQQQHAVLVTLSMQGPVSGEEIGRMLEHSDHAPSNDTLARMVEHGLLSERDGAYVWRPAMMIGSTRDYRRILAHAR